MFYKRCSETTSLLPKLAAGSQIAILCDEDFVYSSVFYSCLCAEMGQEVRYVWEVNSLTVKI